MIELDPSQFNVKQRALYDNFIEDEIPLTDGVRQKILDLASKKPGRKPKPTETVAPAPVVRDKNEEAANELILRSLWRPGSIRIVKCKQCTQEFGTNYYSVAYCSRECRAAALADMGLDYDYEKPEGLRYDGHVPPTTIPPEDLIRLKEWARVLLQMEKPSQPPTKDQLALSLPEDEPNNHVQPSALVRLL